MNYTQPKRLTMTLFPRILLTILILSIGTPSPANPLSSILSVFQRDLTITVEYTDHQNLIPDSKVYWAKDLHGEKILIGMVKKVSRTREQKSQVGIVIDKAHKDKIFETTPFVLMGGLFSESSNSYILAVGDEDASGKSLLKSGATIAGVTFLEYKMAEAGEEFKKVMDRIKKQHSELQRQLEEYIDTFNAEEFQERLDDLLDQLSQFSEEPKEHFKNNVLPSLKKAFESMVEKLEKQNNTEKSKDLEKKFKEIEDLVDV